MSRITIVTGIPVREDLRNPHAFKIGDRVRAKNRHDLSGVVASLPRGPVAKLGRHVVGNDMGVDLDGGGRAVCDVVEWERLPEEDSALQQAGKK